MSNTPDQQVPVKTERCPLCGQPAPAGDAPFCSPRCRDRDLIQWLDEGYRLPGRPLGGDDAAADGGDDG